MKTFAKALAIASGLMFLLPFGFYLFGNTTYNFTDYATFVGGTAGPMAALAGFLFIYLTFQHQQEQIDKHDKQFAMQSFESTFFRLLDHYRTERYSLDTHRKHGQPLGRDCFHYIKEGLFKLEATSTEEPKDVKNNIIPALIARFPAFYEENYRLSLSEYQRSFLILLKTIDEHRRYSYLKYLSAVMDENEMVIQAFYYRAFGFDLSIDVVQEYDFLQNVSQKAFTDHRYYHWVFGQPLPEPEDLSDIAPYIIP